MEVLNGAHDVSLPSAVMCCWKNNVQLQLVSQTTIMFLPTVAPHTDLTMNNAETCRYSKAFSANDHPFKAVYFVTWIKHHFQTDSRWVGFMFGFIF